MIRANSGAMFGLRSSRFVELGCVLGGLLAAGALVGCQKYPAAPDGPSCEERKAHLVEVLDKLPAEGMGTAVGVGLPVSTLSGAASKGPLLEISDRPITLDGAAIPGATQDEQLASLRRMLAERSIGVGAADERTARGITLAVAASTDVRTLHAILLALPEGLAVNLLFARPPLPPDARTEAERSDGERLAEQVLAEPDPTRRHALADAAYADYTDCEGITRAAAAVKGANAKERWPRLRAGMQQAVPQCACEDMDAEALRHLLVAEQRAGSVALGTVTISFLRDERCNASMPLDSMQQLLDEIDEFDAEFSGDWKEDALVFEKVVTDERLLNYLCVATAGDTLAALQRKASTLYLRAEGQRECQAWTFEPLSRGAPMGTWRRTSSGGEPLAIHYRQGAEEIRLFGPVTGAPAAAEQSRPTDPGPWSCNEDVKMVGVDERSIQLEGGGAWYLDEASCRAAAPTVAMTGCIGKLIAGLPIPPPAAEPPPEPTPAASAAPTEPEP